MAENKEFYLVCGVYTESENNRKRIYATGYRRTGFG